MFNLIIKDFIIQKKTLWLIFIYPLVASFAFTNTGSNGTGLYAMAPVAITYIFVIYAVSYDEKNKSEVILNSLPLKREDIVISKYLSIFLFASIGILLSVIIGFIGKSLSVPTFTRMIRLSDIVLTLCIVCCYNSIFYPLYFKFGIIKMKVFNIIFFILLFSIPSIIKDIIADPTEKIYIENLVSFLNNTSSLVLAFISLSVALIIFLISLLIYIRIYNNKEF